MSFSKSKDISLAILTLRMDYIYYAFFISCFLILLAYLHILIWQIFPPAVPYFLFPEEDYKDKGRRQRPSTDSIADSSTDLARSRCWCW
ncbi:hypothetical protein F5883DRAFT_714028 [Diaporthe sp. PMI_573]|nr:hypothetical protein F5883DRAFT_714028 [Diaporthaceae sp. PMI_573]